MMWLSLSKVRSSSLASLLSALVGFLQRMGSVAAATALEPAPIELGIRYESARNTVMGLSGNFGRMVEPSDWVPSSLSFTQWVSSSSSISDSDSDSLATACSGKGECNKKGGRGRTVEDLPRRTGMA